jgi:hypothetical protein
VIVEIANIEAEWVVGCVVRCVGLFFVEGMDVCSLLESQVGHSCRESIPDCWGSSSVLLDAGPVGALIGVIRRLDDRSDRVLLALLEGGARGDPLGTAVIVAALVGAGRRPQSTSA